MHVILYILDALRADHLGCYGYERNISHNIDGIAKQGVTFENCFTSSTWTRPVAASILTGTYPDVHLTRTRYEKFSTSLRRLPEILQQANFKTAAFVAMGNIAGDIGFNKGFIRYHDLFRDEEILQKRRNISMGAILFDSEDGEIALPLAEDINAYLFDWLGENRDENTFNFIWSIEPHEPYRPPKRFRQFSRTSIYGKNDGDTSDIRSSGRSDRQRLINLYDDEISYNDHCIGEIIAFLMRNNIYDDTMLIIAGDHGEAFYEHGVYSHGHAPYEYIIHVPLIMKFPYGKYGGSRVSPLTELIDIYPTLTSFIGIDHDDKGDDFVQGKNLIPLLEGDCTKVRDYCFSDTRTLQIHNRYLSVRDQRWKYIRVQRPPRNRSTIIATLKHIIERNLIRDILHGPRHFMVNYFGKSNELLFDLIADPGEQINLINKYPELLSKYRRVLDDRMKHNMELAQMVGDNSLTYEEGEILKDHLAKLGYL
jgi:arylsulfatase A-like enzyme